MSDPRLLFERAARWPLELELACNMPLSLAGRLTDRPAGSVDPAKPAPFLAMLHGAGRPVGAAIEDAGLLVIAAEWPHAAAVDGITEPLANALADALADALAGALEKITGLLGPEDLVLSLARALSRRPGSTRRLEVGMRDHFYRLDALRPQGRRPPGTVRRATAADRDLIIAWLESFVADAHLPPLDCASMADHLVGRGDVLLWTVGRSEAGEAVSMAAVSGRTPRCARIGFVYTPDAARGRGYGAAVTAAVTRHALDTGAEACCLYADAENDLTNRLYRRLGFTRAGAMVDIALVGPANQPT